MSKRLNANRIKINRNYTVADASAELGVQPRTVRNWVHAGLTVIDDGRPLLIQGADLKIFLKRKRNNYLHRCELTEMFCFKCRSPKKPNIDSLEFIAKPAGMAQMIGFCNECGKLANKYVSWRDVNQIWAELGGVLPIPEERIFSIKNRLLK